MAAPSIHPSRLICPELKQTGHCSQKLTCPYNHNIPKIPTSAPPSQPSHSAGPSTWRGRGGNSVPVAPKSSAPNPSMNGIGAKGFGKGKGGYDGGKGGWDGKGGYDGGKGGFDGGKGGYDGGKGAFDGGKGKGYYQEGPSQDDRPDERTGGNAMDITNLLPMFRDDSSPPSGQASDHQQQQHFQGSPAREDAAAQPVVSGASGEDGTVAQGEQQPSMEHLKQEWAMLQHKLEQQRNEGRGMMKAAAAQDEGLVGGEPSQPQQQQHASPPPRFEDSYQERRLENSSSGQLLQQQQQQQQQQPEGYEDTYPDQYPREEAAAPREQPDTRRYQESALPTPSTGPVGMAPPLPQRGYVPPPQHVDDRYMQQQQQQQPYGQLGPQASQQEPRRIIGYEHMVGTDISRRQEPAFGPGVGEQQQQARYAGSYQQQQQQHPQRDMGERMRPVEYDGPPRVNGRLQAAENNAALMRPATRYDAERNGPAAAPRDAEHRIERDLPPPRREDFAPDPRQSLSQVRYSEPRQQQQQQQSYYSSEDYIDPYDPRRAEPSSRGEYYQPDRSDRYEREPMRYASHEDPLCPDSLRRTEYDREYRRSPAVQPRYDTRRQTEESLRWPHAGRTYKDDVQQVRDSRARFIESRPDPWYARPRIGHRQMPKIRFEHDERRMVFVDDANQLVSMPFDLSVEDMYRDITKDSVKHMSREELRALRLRLQQERGRLDERLEECHNHHGDMVTRMFNLDYTPAVDPHPRLLWGLEAFDREASTAAAAAAHPPLRSSDNRDLISFDRRSVTSSSDGRRYDEAAAPVRTPDRGMLPGPPSPPRALGPPSVDSMSALRSPPVQPVMMQQREFEQWEQAASRGSGRADSVPDGCCPMCHAKFPDEDSLQQHAENCNDQCPERTEGPSRPGVGHPVIVKSSYTPDAGDDNQLPLSVGDEVLLSELDNDGSGWTMVNKDGDLGWVPTAVLDLELRGRR